MSSDCQWIMTKLEDLLPDDGETRQQVEAHIESCTPCRLEYEGHQKLDHLLRAYVERHAAGRAPSPQQLQPVRLGLAAAGLGVVLLGLWLVAGGRGTEISPIGAVEGVETALVKAGQSPDSLRAKPDRDPGPSQPGATGARVPDVDDALGQQFYVADAAGYFYSLSDFSGSVLIVGVFDRSGRGMAGLERLSETYRSRPEIRVLGVELEREPPTRRVSFLMMTNRGSSLMGTPAGAFSVIGPDGAVETRGSLEDDALDAIVASSLSELGVSAP